jgi:hypothetical protein
MKKKPGRACSVPRTWAVWRTSTALLVHTHTHTHTNNVPHHMRPLQTPFLPSGRRFVSGKEVRDVATLMRGGPERRFIRWLYASSSPAWNLTHGRIPLFLGTERGMICGCGEEEVFVSYCPSCTILCTQGEKREWRSLPLDVYYGPAGETSGWQRKRKKMNSKEASCRLQPRLYRVRYQNFVCFLADSTYTHNTNTSRLPTRIRGPTYRPRPGGRSTVRACRVRGAWAPDNANPKQQAKLGKTSSQQWVRAGIEQQRAMARPPSSGATSTTPPLLHPSALGTTRTIEHRQINPTRVLSVSGTS